MRVVRSDASKCVIGPMPFLTSCWARRNSSAPMPIGVTGPSPVTTTLFMPVMLSGRLSADGAVRHRPGCQNRLLLVLRDEVDRITDGADAFGLLVADLDAELVLEAHDQFDHVQRVCAEILDE